MARQLIVESVILTLLAAAAGLIVGYGALRLLGTLNIQELPRGAEIRLDGVVVAYTLGTAAVIGFVLGLIPVASVLPANLNVVLREEGRSGTSGRGARTLRRALVVAQVAFAFVLLVGAGLLFASFRRVLAVDPGFTADSVMTASISLPRARYTDDAALIRFTDEALRRLRALPGVTAVGATDTIPFGGNNNDSVILAEGYQMKPGESVISPSAVDVTPGYFEAMGVRLVRGRFFDDRDAPIEKKTTAIGGRPKAPIRSSSTRRSRSDSGPDRTRSAVGCTSRTTSHRAISRRLTRRPCSSRSSAWLGHQAPRPHRGREIRGRLLLSDGPGHLDRHDVRPQDRRRPAVADERRPRRTQQTRPRAAGLRHSDDGSADGEVAGQPALAGRAVARASAASRCCCRRSGSTASSRTS